MTLDALIMLCGTLVALLSIAGFPPSWYKPMFFILGIVVVILGIVVRRRRGQWETAVRRYMQRDLPADAPLSSVHEEKAAEDTMAA